MLSNELNKNKPMNGSSLIFKKADSINDSDLIVMDEANQPDVFSYTKYMSIFNNKENYEMIPFEDSFKFRPDLIALKYYGTDYLYPLVLNTNNINSMTEFIPEASNYELKIIKLSVLKSIYKV